MLWSYIAGSDDERSEIVAFPTLIDADVPAIHGLKASTGNGAIVEKLKKMNFRDRNPSTLQLFNSCTILAAAPFVESPAAWERVEFS
jgi:hypothetical protein